MFLGLVGEVFVVPPAEEAARVNAPIVVRPRVVLFHKLGRCIPRFVGIETIHPEEEILALRIVFEELGCAPEQLCAVPILWFFAVAVRSGIGLEEPISPDVFAEACKHGLVAPVVRPGRGIVDPVAINFGPTDERPRVKRPIEVVSAVD